MAGGYGGADILQGCELEVAEGEVVVVVGPNGAGKSTAMKALFGMLTLRQGRVFFSEDDITALAPQERVALGMGFVPQNANVFTSMT
ncbi:MAG: ATP-binding cassette domain-containing protein, partial [Gammaproteobacteria bacterium]